MKFHKLKQMGSTWLTSYTAPELLLGNHSHYLSIIISFFGSFQKSAKIYSQKKVFIKFNTLQCNSFININISLPHNNLIHAINQKKQKEKECHVLLHGLFCWKLKGQLKLLPVSFCYDIGFFSVTGNYSCGKFVMTQLNADQYFDNFCKNNLVPFWWQGWPSGESTCLPPMWSGFDFRTRRHTWIEFVGSLLCYERFSPGYSGFPLSPKTNI